MIIINHRFLFIFLLLLYIKIVSLINYILLNFKNNLFFEYILSHIIFIATWLYFPILRIPLLVLLDFNRDTNSFVSASAFHVNLINKAPLRWEHFFEILGWMLVMITMMIMMLMMIIIIMFLVLLPFTFSCDFSCYVLLLIVL